MGSSCGTVFNIQRFTVHDGPGIRTEIFIKGCTLRCKWCSNPESFLEKEQVGVFPTKCIGTEKCGDCADICPQGAETLRFRDGKIEEIDRTKCTDCMKCTTVCPTDSLKAWGRKMTVDEVMKLVLADRAFYDNTGGGVTISGGEALFQWEFVLEILKRCKEEGIHTCVESALNINRSVVEAVLPYCDMLITDIKMMDAEQHKKYTGAGNGLILDNIRYISSKRIPMVIRLPIIPGVNNNLHHVREVGRFMTEAMKERPVQVQFLRFRRLGEEKYRSLGMPYRMEDVDPERNAFEADIKEMVEVLRKFGLPAYAGTTHKINVSLQEV